MAVSQDQANAYFDQVRNQPGSASKGISMGAVTAQQVMDYYTATHPAAAAPETQALQQIAQIDPTSEALRGQLASSYLGTVNQPTAADLQGYTNMATAIDPTAMAGRQQLESQLTSQAALGSQLDPETQREVEQATLRAQQGRGNIYGTPQLVEEAMTTGEAGLALQQQRQQALQSYLTSGQTVGDVTMGMYGTMQQQRLQNQNAALTYLGSGQTPYQVGAAYVDNANATAAGAAQGGPQYNPSALGEGLTGSSQQSSQYGLDMSQSAQNWYNSFSSNIGGVGATKNKTAAALSGAASGALSGAASGATIGSIVPGVGTAIGAVAGGVIGGVAGGASSYYG
jgi:hypothetical protein